MAMNDLKQKLARLGQDTKNGVQKVSDSVSISNRISAEKKSLGRLYATIGEAVYKASPEEPRAGLEDEWAAVKVAYANIEAFTEQLNHVKGIVYCPTCGRPASQGDKFCAKCGTRLLPTEETTREKVVSDLKEAGQEAGKLMGSAADRTGEMVGSAAANTKNAFTRFKEGCSKLAKNVGSRFARQAEEEPSGLEEVAFVEEELAAEGRPVEAFAAEERPAEEPAANEAVEEPAANEVLEGPAANEVLEEPQQNEAAEEPAANEVLEEPAANEAAEAAEAAAPAEEVPAAFPEPDVMDI